MKNIQMFMHFHRDFPFNFESSWVKACYAGGTGPYEWHPPSDKGPFTNVTRGGILKYRHHYSSVEESDFLKAMGQQATECYVANTNIDADYYGVGSYRRYLLLTDAYRVAADKVTMPATEESVKFLTSDAQLKAASKFLDSADVIINRARVIDVSIEEQYLQSQHPEYWNLFKEAIVKTNSNYEKHMWWFTGYNVINYEGVYIMHKSLVKHLLAEYFSIMEYIWKNCSKVYPTERKTSEIFPWRYPGFLNERFVPFFMYANSLRKVEVPLVFLD